MAITQVGTGSGSGNTSSAAFTPSGTRAAGDIVVVVGYQRPGQALTVAATGLTFTAVVTATDDATYGSMGAWWARYSGTSNPQITVSGASGANVSIAAAGVVLRGADASASPLTNVGSITNQAAAASFTVTGPTGVAADTVMIGVGGSLDNNAPTADWSGGAGSGSSVTVDNAGGTDNALGLAWEWVASGTAGNFVYTETANGNDAGRTLIFGVKVGNTEAASAAGSLTLGGIATEGQYLTRLNTFDNGTADTSVTLANSADSGYGFSGLSMGSGSLTYRSSPVMHGARSAQSVTGGGGPLWWYTVPAQSAIMWAAYLRWSSFTNENIMSIRNDLGGGGQVARFGMGSDGTPFLTDNASTIWTGTALSTGVWYRVELIAEKGTTTSNGRAAIAIYEGDATSPIQTYDPGATVNTGTLSLPYVTFEYPTVYVDSVKMLAGRTEFPNPWQTSSTPASATGSLALTGSVEAKAAAPSIAGSLDLTATAEAHHRRVNSFDAGNADTGVTVTNSAYSGDQFSYKVTNSPNTLIYRSSPVMHGARSAESYSDSTQTGDPIFGWTLEDSVAVLAVLYVRWATLPSVAHTFMHVRNSSGPITTAQLTVDNKLRLTDQTGTAFTSTAALSANTWYRVELLTVRGTTTSNGRSAIAYYEGDSTTAVESYDSGYARNTGVDPYNDARAGHLAGTGASHTMYVDSFMVLRERRSFPNVWDTSKGWARVTGSLELTGSATALDGAANILKTMRDDTVGITDRIHIVTGTTVTDAGVGITDASLTADLEQGSVPASATGSLSLSGSAVGAAPVTAAGSLALTGSAVAAAPVTSTTGALSLSGSVNPAQAVTAAGSLALTGSAVGEGKAPAITGSLALTGSAAAAGAAIASGSLALTGSAAWRYGGTIAGSLSLTGSAAWVYGGTIAGSITLTGSAAWVAGSVTGALSLSGSAAGAAPVTAAGSLALSGSAVGAAPATAAGSLSLTGSAAAAATGAATGSIALTGSATAGGGIAQRVDDPVGVTDHIDIGMGVRAAGSLALTGSAVGAATGTITGALSLTGTGTPAAPATASGSLALTGTAAAQAPVSAVGSLALSGTATAGGTTNLTDRRDDTVGVTDRTVVSVGVVAAGSLTLSGTATAAVRGTITGALSLTGAATPAAPVTAAGSLALSGSAAWQYGGTIAGSLTLTGSGAVQAPVTAAGSVALSGSAGGAAPVTTTGSLSLTGTAAAAAPAAASGSLTFDGSASVAYPATATGGLNLTGSVATVGTLSQPPTSVVSAGTWTNGSNAYTDDGNVATNVNTTRNTDYPLQLGGFDFSALPDDATIVSVHLLTQAWRSAANAVTEKVWLYDGATTIGTQQTQSLTATADGTTWDTTWSPTVAQLKSANFKVEYVSRRTATGAVTTYLDFARVVVEYTVPVRPRAEGYLTLSGSATAVQENACTGALSLTGSVAASSITVPASATGALALTGSVAAAGRAQAAGSLTLAAQVGAAGSPAATGALALSGTATAKAAATAAGAVTLTGLVTIGHTATGSLTLTGSTAAAAAAVASGAVTLTGAAVGAAPTTATGSLGLGGTAGGRVHADTLGLLTLSGFADVYGAATAVGGLSLAGTATPTRQGEATGTLALSGYATARALARKPPRLEAHLTATLAEVGAVKVWAYDSTPTVRGVAEATAVQVEVRAWSKQQARARSYAARELILALPGGVWHDGIVLGVSDLQGPSWVPDNDGAPRYVFRCTVTYRPTR